RWFSERPPGNGEGADPWGPRLVGSGRARQQVLAAAGADAKRQYQRTVCMARAYTAGDPTPPHPTQPNRERPPSRPLNRFTSQTRAFATSGRAGLAGRHLALV